MNSNELFSDVVSYAPDLAMVVSDDDVATAQSKISKCITWYMSPCATYLLTSMIGIVFDNVLWCRKVVCGPALW